jgi:hypothetical protein
MRATSREACGSEKIACGSRGGGGAYDGDRNLFVGVPAVLGNTLPLFKNPH